MANLTICVSYKPELAVWSRAQDNADSSLKADEFRRSLLEKLLQEDDEREIYTLFNREGIDSLFRIGRLLA